MLLSVQPPMPEPFLELVDMSKIYPGVVALDHVDLSVSRGEVIALIGEIWASLRAGGIGVGSHIGVALPSGLESVLSTVAIASHATCVPLNPPARGVVRI